MEFRLIYDGRLPAQSRNNARVSDKHRIRKVFHKQLAELWDKHPALQRYVQLGIVKGVAADFPRGNGFSFVPLVSQKYGGAFAALNILFLRRGNPGDLLRNQGDIDNRIKVLLDALKVPKYASDLAEEEAPEEHEKPFYCLLEDDALITEINITTDRLLWPVSDSADESKHPLNDVVLVIHVKTSVANRAAMWSEAFW
ncbi:MAG TPA: hypothetical protein VMU80_23025 [Bryobacteraceae bacterium]|nr:hypothetical protein [Bryobacteraceae bacterium]